MPSPEELGGFPGFRPSAAIASVGTVNSADLVPLLLLAIPLLSLAGIAASATARERSHRWIYGVLGWIGWLSTVAVGVFAGFVAIAFSCMGSSPTNDCGENAAPLVLIVGVTAAALPGVIAYGLAGRRRLPRPQ